MRRMGRRLQLENEVSELLRKDGNGRWHDLPEYRRCWGLRTVGSSALL